MRILITGGVGFIGSHLTALLLSQGHQVTILDSLEKQVHGDRKEYKPPAGLAHFERGFCGDPIDLILCHEFAPFDAVYHLAAVVGVGQSQSEVGRYHQRNVQDTADMLQWWIDNPPYRPKRLIVASSMSIYGEGYRDKGIDEFHIPRLPNQYALTKYNQEIACLNFGRAFDIPTTALRFFNVVGEGQSLSNPYTGIAALIAARLLHGKGGILFEDGNQIRDFVHVSDIVQALSLALTAPPEVIHGEAFNIGTGVPTTLKTLHGTLAKCLGVDIPPTITGETRRGDIRFCYSDITKARRLLGYVPRMDLASAMDQYASWLKTQDATQVLSRVEGAAAELREKGLLGNK